MTFTGGLSDKRSSIHRYAFTRNFAGMNKDRDDTLSVIGGCAGLIAGCITIASVVLLFLRGFEWYSIVVVPWLIRAVPLLLPLDVLLAVIALYRPVRKVTGALIFALSHIVFAVVWLMSLVMCYSTGKAFAVILGLCLGVIGVVPVALFGCFTHRYWSEFVMILLFTAFGIASRAAAFFILGRSESI